MQLYEIMLNHDNYNHIHIVLIVLIVVHLIQLTIHNLIDVYINQYKNDEFVQWALHDSHRIYFDWKGEPKQTKKQNGAFSGS